MVWDVSHADAESFRCFDIGTRSSLRRRKADGTTRRKFAWAAVWNRALLRLVCIPQVCHQMRRVVRLDQSLRSLCSSFC